jgi:hypothetical protein
MTQWHPLFAQLLRPILESYYEVETNVPVGDAPRQADIVLLRRKSTQKPPFRGLWKDLTAWNVLEFKGPTVSARLDDLDELVELGLGIYRRLNEERVKEKRAPLEPAAISWWYLANRLGRRFLRDAPACLGELQPWGQGVWRCALMQRQVYLVSRSELPVEQESLPLHVLAKEPPETEQAVARVLAREPRLLQDYTQWIGGLHPSLAEELLAMAKSTEKGFKFHWEPLIRIFGMKRIIDELGLKRVIDAVGPKRVIDEIGLKRVLDAVGPKRVIEEFGLDSFLADLTPAQKRELKQRLS